MATKTIVFPSVCASLGGAQSVKLSGRYACVTKADGTKFTCPRKSLPPRPSWTSFNLADAVNRLSG